LYRIGTRQSDVIDEKRNRTVKLSTRQFTIGNAQGAVSGLLHEIEANQLVSILQIRIPKAK
jgi:hypothetical protein